MSDKLQPLVDGVHQNKVHWLDLAQNVQNNRKETPADETDPVDTESKATNNNNNTYRTGNNEDSISTTSGAAVNGGVNEIPKIVGKLGRLDSRAYFQSINGFICENSLPALTPQTATTLAESVALATRNLHSSSADEAMDQ